jgi:hypothetical protein
MVTQFSDSSRYLTHFIADFIILHFLIFKVFYILCRTICFFYAKRNQRRLLKFGLQGNSLSISFDIYTISLRPLDKYDFFTCYLSKVLILKCFFVAVVVVLHLKILHCWESAKDNWFLYVWDGTDTPPNVIYTM